MKERDEYDLPSSLEEELKKKERRKQPGYVPRPKTTYPKIKVDKTKPGWREELIEKLWNDPIIADNKKEDDSNATCIFSDCPSNLMKLDTDDKSEFE